LSDRIFNKTIQVSKAHLDDLNHVNNTVYVTWVQDVANAHWKSCSNDDINDAYFWVLIDHHIAYKGQAFLGDHITVSTYFSETNKLKSQRIVEFYKNDRLIVKSTTTWCLMDRKTDKLARIPDQLLEIILPPNTELHIK
jgi:acyl-CoA thioester hydrolase